MRGRKKNPDTRAAILECASQAFAQRQFHEVLTDDIAAQLGIGKGTIYRYFESKEALYFATIVAGLDGMHEAIQQAVARPAALSVVIERLVETVLRYFWARRDFFTLLYRHEPKLDPQERAEWQQGREQIVTQVQRLLETRLPPGSLGRDRSRLAIEFLLGMVRAASLYRETSDQPEPLARMITAAFLDGVKVNRASRGKVRARGQGTGRQPELKPLRGGGAR
jgi:AcrR family transcriptional regulator